MSVLDALLEGFSDELHPRGFHGRWIRSGDHHELRIMHGSTELGRVPAAGRIAMMIGASSVIGKAGKTISTADVGRLVDHSLREMGPEGPRKKVAASSREPRWQVGDLVVHQHGMFGQVPATISKVTKERVHITSQDPRVRPTSMTHNQAAVKLRHQNLDEARRFARQRLGIKEADATGCERQEVLDALLLSEQFVSQDKRSELAKKGHALHVDGKGIFPIENAKDADNAATLWLSGHHKTAQAKAHIIRNARRVGATDVVKKLGGS